jgi:hypothetical protein
MGSLWSSWRLPAAIAGVVAAVLIAIAPRVAEAQSVNISSAGISRQEPLRADITGRFKVSYSDCLAADKLSFPVQVSNFGGSVLEVWATQSTSDNCRDDTARTSASATCWMVYQITPNNINITVTIPVQDFCKRPPVGTTDGRGLGNADSCIGTSTAGQPITLWFMFMQGTTQVGDAATWPTSVDLLGPVAPVVGNLGAGSNLLKLDWQTNTDPDLVQYRAFCEDLGAQSGVTIYEAGSPGPEASVPTPPICDGGQGEDSGEDGGEDDAGGVADAGCIPPPVVSDSGSGPGADCPSIFVAGVTPSPDAVKKYECGSPGGRTSTSMVISGLENGHKYAVAMASSDLVENVGPLSTVQCGVPVMTDSFDQVYRNAGGTAGGNSFCSVGVGSGVARSTLWPGAAFAAVVVLRRWRRRRAV